MTDRKQALTELLEKVVAGDVYDNVTDQNLDQVKIPFDLFFGPCNGSLDAAKALHEAVLPGWVCRLKIGADYNPSQAILEPLTPRSGNPCGLSEWSETPARAWLIAILKALIAKEDE